MCHSFFFFFDCLLKNIDFLGFVADHVGEKERVAERLEQEAIENPVHVMSTNASTLVDSVEPPSAEVCRTAASFP